VVVVWWSCCFGVMGSAVSVSEADANACSGDVKDSSSNFSGSYRSHVGEEMSNSRGESRLMEAATLTSAADATTDVKNIAMTPRTQLMFRDFMNKKSELFMKQALLTNVDVEGVKEFLSNPSSMSLYKMFLRKRMDTPEATAMLAVCYV
jgi:hypothetical protein